MRRREALKQRARRARRAWLPPAMRCMQAGPPPEEHALPLAELVGSIFHPGRVLEVGGGGEGELAQLLRDAGFHVHGVDPGCTPVRSFFEPAVHPLKVDLVVSHHPCAATMDVALGAAVCPTVLIPCCDLWPGSVAQRIRGLWRRLGLFWGEAPLAKGRASLAFIAWPAGQEPTSCRGPSRARPSRGWPR